MRRPPSRRRSGACRPAGGGDLHPRTPLREGLLGQGGSGQQHEPSGPSLPAGIESHQVEAGCQALAALVSPVEGQHMRSSVLDPIQEVPHLPTSQIVHAGGYLTSDGQHVSQRGYFRERIRHRGVQCEPQPRRARDGGPGGTGRPITAFGERRGRVRRFDEEERLAEIIRVSYKAARIALGNAIPFTRGRDRLPNGGYSIRIGRPPFWET